MLPLHLNILLKIKIAELFGKVSVIEKYNIDSIPFKNIIINTKNHHNNLIGKVECYNNLNFYYIPIKCIENYEIKDIGIDIYSDLSICPFCSGIQLDIDEQYKYYKIMKKKDCENNANLTYNLSNDIYILLQERFCFDLIKKNINSYEAYLIEKENKKNSEEKILDNDGDIKL